MNGNKGRNAAKAFTATRDARFAESRKRTRELQEEQRRNGERRTMLLVDVEDVQDGDEVLVEGQGFTNVEETTRGQWVTRNGQTTVMRFVR